MAKRTWTTDEIITKTLLDNVLYGSADGESADDLTKLAVKDQSGAGSKALEILVSETLAADRVLTITVGAADRAITLSGNLVLGGTLTTAAALTTVGANALILRTTAPTDVTLPTTGTLVTLDGNETLTTKTLTSPDINGGTADALTSLGIRSTGAAFDLKLATAVAFTATRTLAVTIPDAPTALTLTGDLIRIGAHSLTLRTSGATDITLPASGTLITNAVTALASLITVGTLTTGTWNADVVTAPYGGTGLSTITDHGVMIGSGVGAVTPLAAGTALQILQSGGAAADPTWSTATYPATTTANQILYSSGANVVAGLATGASGVLVTSAGGVPSIATDIPTAVTIGAAYIYRASGTDVPMLDGGTGASLVAAAGAIPYSGAAAMALLAAGAAGQLLRSGGAAAPTWTTLTMPATIGANEILYASNVNVLGVIASVNSSVLVTSGAGVPFLATDIPTAVTIGAAYIYRVGGTDVAVADGGTGLGVYAVGDILHATAVGALAGLADVSVGQVLCSGGVGVIAAWSATPTFTSSVQTGRGEVGRVNLKDDTEITLDANGEATITQGYHSFDTNADGATDDLEAIIGGAEGDILIFRPDNAGRTIVAKHAGAPTAGAVLNLAGGVAFTMDEDDDWLMLLFDGTLWQEIGRSENHA